MAITLVGSVATSIPGTTAAITITVPAGVTTSHLGILFLSTDNAGATTYTVSGSWTNRVLNPSVQTNSEVAVYSKLGGLVAGNTFTVASSLARNVQVTALWVNTGGQDISIVGTPGGRSGVSASTVVIPAVTTTLANSDVLVLSTERTTATPTTISSWSPSAPTQLYYLEYNTAATSQYVGTFTQATAGTTGSRTATYNGASGNGVGVMLVVPPAAVSGAGSASAAFGATGTVGAQSRTGAGSASAALNATGAGTAVVGGAGAASASTGATGAGTTAPKGSGSGSAAFGATGAGKGQTSGTGSGSVTTNATGAGGSVLSGSGSGSASSSATGEGSNAVEGSGIGQATFSAAGDGVLTISGEGSGSAGSDSSGSATTYVPVPVHYGYAALVTNGTSSAPLVENGVSEATLISELPTIATLTITICEAELLDGTGDAELISIVGAAELTFNDGQAVLDPE